jgi:U3 small nucleolar RNA-associated protein 14
MAKVEFEKIVDELKIDMKPVLEEFVSKSKPKVKLSRELLFREFRKALAKRITSWVVVNDRNVDKVCRHCGEK